MIKYAVLLIALTVNAYGQTYTDYKSFITFYEGTIAYPSKDHIGIGHHQVGLKNRHYTESEINQLYTRDFDIALSDAHTLFPSFDQQPSNVKLVLVSLSFNLGFTRLSKFTKFRAAIAQNNYTNAADELRRSKWFTDVKRRGPAHCATIEQSGRVRVDLQ